MIMHNISRKVIDNVLMNIPPSNIFTILLLLERVHQRRQAALSINVLILVF